MRSVAARLTVVVVALVIGTLVFEGLYSTFRGQSLLRPWFTRQELGLNVGTGLDLWPEMTDEQKARFTTVSPGALAWDEDPGVGARLKPHLTQHHSRPARTDGYGMRVRTGPKPRAGATRVVILGDSVAFSQAVPDDRTFGTQVELALAATMEKDRPPPVVHTVACPGWNFRSQRRYLKNHMDRLDPSVVVHIPVENDLDDTFGVSEQGWRLHLDPSVGLGRLSIYHQDYVKFVQKTWKRLAEDVKRRYLDAGRRAVAENVLVTNITPESRRRWHRIMSELRAFDQRLKAQGRHLLVCFLVRDRWSDMYTTLAAEAVPDLKVHFIFKSMSKGDAVPGDGHPGPKPITAASRRIAELIIERKWIDGAGARPLPGIDPDFADRYAGSVDILALRDSVSDFRRRHQKLIGRRLDLVTGEGIHQVYGGFDHDGTIGRMAMLALRNEGGTLLDVRLLRRRWSSAVYPLTLAVRVGSRLVGPLSVPPPPEDVVDGDDLFTTLTFDVGSIEGEFVDVTLYPSEWVAEKSRQRTRLASVQVASVELR